MRFALVAFTLLAAPLLAGAQSISSLSSLTGVSGDAFDLSADSQYPAPYSQVTITPTSNSLDIANATLTASVGGKQVYAGAANSFTVELGAAGSVTTIHATLTSQGSSYTQTLSLEPQDVTVIAEPIASVPPLYPGKPSAPIQGSVRFVAVANLKGTGSTASRPSTYSYVWTVDNVEQIDSSGVGKSSIILPSPLEYSNSTVSVVVTDSSGNISGGDSLTYSAVDPTIRVYEDDPLLGLRYDHALSDSYTINGAEATLYAAPFSLPISGGAPVVQWFLGGAPAQTGNSVTLRPAGSGQGDAALSVTATGDNATNATANLSLTFGTQASNTFFGL